MPSIFDQVKLQAQLTDEVIVSYSGGKDSAVVLELCHRYFKKVHVFFMYTVQGLSFQEAVLKWAEQRYGVEIYRIPHWELSHAYRSGAFVRFDPNVPVLSIKDTYSHVRAVTGAHWIAAGERAKDSVVRGAMIKKSGSVEHVRGRFYPIAYWSKEEVIRYCALHKLKYSPEAGVLKGASLNNWHPEKILALKQHYPADYERIEAAFPLIGALVAKAELYGADPEDNE
jgi:phosphoadenosine phosphosulfate reductase